MNWLRTVLIQMFTEKDNGTTDVVRVVAGTLAFVGGVEYLVLAAWNVIVNKVAFDYAGFGAGLGLVIGALGAAVAAKALTERKP